MSKDELKEILTIVALVAIVILVFTVGTWAPKAHAQTSCYTIYTPEGKAVICCRTGTVVACY